MRELCKLFHFSCLICPSFVSIRRACSIQRVQPVQGTLFKVFSTGLPGQVASSILNHLPIAPFSPFVLSVPFLRSSPCGPSSPHFSPFVSSQPFRLSRRQHSPRHSPQATFICGLSNRKFSTSTFAIVTTSRLARLPSRTSFGTSKGLKDLQISAIHFYAFKSSDLPNSLTLNLFSFEFVRTREFRSEPLESFEPLR